MTTKELGIIEMIPFFTKKAQTKREKIAAGLRLTLSFLKFKKYAIKKINKETDEHRIQSAKELQTLLQNLTIPDTLFYGAHETAHALKLRTEVEFRGLLTEIGWETEDGDTFTTWDIAGTIKPSSPLSIENAEEYIDFALAPRRGKAKLLLNALATITTRSWNFSDDDEIVERAQALLDKEK